MKTRLSVLIVLCLFFGRMAGQNQLLTATDIKILAAVFGLPIFFAVLQSPDSLI